MKWLKIKKYLKIFSVIICSILIFSNKASALELNNGEIIPEIKNKPSNYYIIAKTNYNNGTYTAIFYDNKFIKNYKGYNNAILLDIPFYTENPNLKAKRSTNKLGGWGFGTKGYFKIVGKYYLENNNWVSADTNNGYDSPAIINLEGNYNNTSNNEIRYIYENINTDEIINYFNDNILYSTVTLFKHYIGNSQFLDIEDGYKIFPIEKKENPLKYRMQFNNDVSPDLKQITFDFSSYEFTEGSNPMKTKIEIGTWKEDGTLSNYLSQVITGYGTDNIETDLTSYFNISIDTTDYLTTKELNFTYTLKQDLPSDILRIKVYYDFETFDNNYFINVFDNATWGSVFWEYIEDFLVGYRKYEFPQGYDLAIIRSKNFSDLDSFYISDKVYFTNPDYDFNLKIYDFNNKIEKYNFNSLTQYLINPVYLKIPIKIDETNNIFPVLTRPSNNESGVFYLKEDLFVQFVNSKNLNSIIDGIPEEEFNDKNDLIISEDIDDLIPPENKEESLTIFFNQFWKMLEKFSDILSYITACFSEFYLSLPTTIQFFLCISFAFVIYKMLVFFIL